MLIRHLCNKKNNKELFICILDIWAARVFSVKATTELVICLAIIKREINVILIQTLNNGLICFVYLKDHK